MLKTFYDFNDGFPMVGSLLPERVLGYFVAVKNNQLFRGFGRFVLFVLLLAVVGCAGIPGSGSRMMPGQAEGTGIQEEYRLHPGDEIDLEIYREPQLSGIFQIDASGLVRHPLCGSFLAAGLTIDEAEAGFTKLLSDKYLVNPRVLISIVSAQSSHVVILGEISNPGVHPIPIGGSMTLLQAIAEAGGFTDLASVDRVTVTRSVDGKEESIRVRVSKMISGRESDLELKPNDVIMVPEIRF